MLSLASANSSVGRGVAIAWMGEGGTGLIGTVCAREDTGRGTRNVSSSSSSYSIGSDARLSGLANLSIRDWRRDTTDEREPLRVCHDGGACAGGAEMGMAGEAAGGESIAE